ncbi:hypothetical protein BD311DRAFT_822138 [Dichomitus squalens]|uniref:F-box domain-containing protein n=1 Tax=Dichomitus squalens TaxID=114155 RepID=A0A4Q9MW30_9APHY|nr:hypothetical protein BD311DRAFT_822138 [Dichomitus squalens]
MASVSSSRSSPIGKLPVDVFDSILSILNEEDRDTLKNCSSVTKQWHDRCVRIIFSSLDINNKNTNAFPAFQTWLSINVDAAAVVKTLRIWKLPVEIDVDQLASVLAPLAGLQNLTLQFIREPQSQIKSSSPLSIQGPRSRSLNTLELLLPSEANRSMLAALTVICLFDTINTVGMQGFSSLKPDLRSTEGLTKVHQLRLQYLPQACASEEMNMFSGIMTSAHLRSLYLECHSPSSWDGLRILSQTFVNLKFVDLDLVQLKNCVKDVDWTTLWKALSSCAQLQRLRINPPSLVDALVTAPSKLFQTSLTSGGCWEVLRELVIGPGYSPRAESLPNRIQRMLWDLPGIVRHDLRGPFPNLDTVTVEVPLSAPMQKRDENGRSNGLAAPTVVSSEQVKSAIVRALPSLQEEGLLRITVIGRT